MFQKPSPDIALDTDESVTSQYSSDDVETVVGPSVHVEGDFSSEGNILVKGTVSGNVKTSKLLTVESGAKIFANVKAGQATISGEILGNIKVNDELHLSSTARVEGDIVCKTLVVEAGCLISGKVDMKGIDIAGKPDKKRGLVRTRTMKTGTDESEA